MAKKFRFTLEGVRKVRAQECDQRRRDTANAVRAVTRAEKQIAELTDMLRSTIDQTQVEQQQKRPDLRSLKGHYSYRGHLQRRILESQPILAEKQRELVAERARLAEASKRLRTIETVRDKRWLRHLTELKREEQADSDEIATQRYIRRHGELRNSASGGLRHPQPLKEDRA